MNDQTVSRQSKMVVRSVEPAVLEQNRISAKMSKRMRVCLRCQIALSKKHKCANCGLRFHDGPFLSWLKRLWGVTPR